MARIERIKISGWMPFAGDHDIELPAGPIAVVARYRDNPRRSNWGGKTALIEAVTWCLFGTHRKRLDDGVINNARPACAVELTLDEGLVVRRNRQRGASTVFTVIDGDEVRRGTAAQQLLAERLGIGLEDYEATVSFRQDDIESLVGMRAGKRREVIATWLRLDRWTHAAKKAAERSRKALQALGEARAALAALDGTSTAPCDATQLEALGRELAGKRADLISIAASIESWGDPDQLQENLDALAHLRTAALDQRSKLARRASVEGDDREAEQALQAAAEARAIANRRYDQLEEIVNSSFDGQCPVMCEACPAADHVQRRVQESKPLLDDAATAVREAEATWRAAQMARLAAGRELHALTVLSGQYEETVARGKALTAQVRGKTHADVEAANRAIGEFEQKRERIEAEITDLIAREASARTQLAAFERARAQREQLTLGVAQAEREVRVAALMLKALGPTGVPARVARAHIASLESAANELLIDAGLSLEFAWERATKDRAPTCLECGHIYVGQRDRKCPSCDAERPPKMSDEVEILVDDGSGEIEDVRAKSGGARVLVASALRLAAAAMLRRVRGARVAWATIDEPFGPLDAELREALARVFSGMLGSVGLEQAFVVSHDQALLDSLPHRLLIERADGVSTVHLEAAA